MKNFVVVYSKATAEVLGKPSRPVKADHFYTKDGCVIFRVASEICFVVRVDDIVEAYEDVEVKT